MIRQVIAVSGLVCLVGCTSIPLSSLPKVAGLSPDTTDFMQLEMAVRMPVDYRLYADGVELSLDIITDESIGLEPAELALTFIPVEGELTQFLKRQEKSGYQIVRFQVDPDDAERAEAYRAEAFRRREEYPKQNRLNFQSKTVGCVVEGANPFRSFRVKTYLRRAENEAFFTLFKERALDFGEESEVKYCETGPDARPLY